MPSIRSTILIPDGMAMVTLPRVTLRAMTLRRGLIVCLLAASWLAVPARAQWSDQTIESARELALTSSALQIDAAGVPHVFVGGDRVYHYWLDGTTWQSEV